MNGPLKFDDSAENESLLYEMWTAQLQLHADEWTVHFQVDPSKYPDTDQFQSFIIQKSKSSSFIVVLIYLEHQDQIERCQTVSFIIEFVEKNLIHINPIIRAKNDIDGAKLSIFTYLPLSRRTRIYVSERQFSNISLVDKVMFSLMIEIFHI